MDEFNDNAAAMAQSRFVQSAGAGVFGDLQPRWRLCTCRWVATPTSDTEITLLSPTAVFAADDRAIAGTPVRWVTDIGLTKYGVIDEVTGLVLSIKGQELSDDIVELAFGLPEMVVQVDLFVGGFFAASITTGLLIHRAPFEWQFNRAHVCGYMAWCVDKGGGAAEIHLTITRASGGSPFTVDDDGVALTNSETKVFSGPINAGDLSLIKRLDTMDIGVPSGGTDATAANLLVSVTMVLE